MLEPTEIHPLFCVEDGAWVRAGDLRVGDHLRTADGTVTVTHIEPQLAFRQVHNLEVDQQHTYYTLATRGLAHNTYPDMPGGASAARAAPGTIYLRRNMATGEEYVGQAKPGRFSARQAEHAASHPAENFNYHVFEEVKPGSGRSLDVVEEDWIRTGGEPQRFGGQLADARYQMSEKAYSAAGAQFQSQHSRRVYSWEHGVQATLTTMPCRIGLLI